MSEREKSLAKLYEARDLLAEMSDWKGSGDLFIVDGDVEALEREALPLPEPADEVGEDGRVRLSAGRLAILVPTDEHPIAELHADGELCCAGPANMTSRLEEIIGIPEDGTNGRTDFLSSVDPLLGKVEAWTKAQPTGPHREQLELVMMATTYFFLEDELIYGERGKEMDSDLRDIQLDKIQDRHRRVKGKIRAMDWELFH